MRNLILILSLLTIAACTDVVSQKAKAAAPNETDSLKAEIIRLEKTIKVLPESKQKRRQKKDINLIKKVLKSMDKNDSVLKKLSEYK